jgi:protein-S-isoprenylcysteine O-methyltransferase Ste14
LAAVSNGSAAKTAYGLFFVVLLPLGLILWAKSTAQIIYSPVINSLPLAVVLCAVGAILLVSGWIALWVDGGGLPMNIAPPPRYVARGIYGLLPHPIYVGFSLLCAGVSVLTHSASGLWLVTPFVMLGSTALVLGYEAADLLERFGSVESARCRILPADELSSSTILDRLRCYLFVILPWLVIYECLLVLGVPADAIETYLPIEHHIPVVQWTELFYASTYALVMVTPLIAKNRHSLRRFCISSWLAMAIVFPIFLAFPLIAPPATFTPNSAFGRLLLWERNFDLPVAAFPSFHVIWAILALQLFVDRWRGLRWLWRIWAACIALSCVTTGMHSIADVLAGVATALIVINPEKTWGRLRGGAERLANSWQEWRLGKLRVVNHGAYAGLGAFVVLVIVGTLTGPGKQQSIFFSAMCGLVGSALWAQFIEGSPRLLRPYGFYGGLIGVSVGVLLTSFHQGHHWLLLGAFCVGGPWLQAIGRLRCLVQGCCHGRPAPAVLGIRYRHPRSRVYRIVEFRDLPLYPTPLYSILWNVYIALAMWRLWELHFPLHFLGGIYLLLNGLGRFVEEAYRGEPQTPAFAGLRLYQWIALTTIFIGAMLTALGRSAAAPAPEFRWQVLPIAIVFGILCGIALGVDFPGSNRRLACLT